MRVKLVTRALKGCRGQAQAAIDRSACERVRSLLVEVTVEQTVIKSPLTTPGGACPN